MCNVKEGLKENVVKKAKDTVRKVEAKDTVKKAGGSKAKKAKETVEKAKAELLFA